MKWDKDKIASQFVFDFIKEWHKTFYYHQENYYNGKSDVLELVLLLFNTFV